MEMKGEQLIPSPQELVWSGLNDPVILQACIPGCQLLAPDGDNEFKVEIVAAVGPVKAKFKGQLKLMDVVAPASYALAFEGSGGPAGFAKGSADVSLRAEEGGTLLCYGVTANIGGKLAQVGSRLIDGISKKMADDFFARFKLLMVDYKPGEAGKSKEAVVEALHTATTATTTGQPAPTAPHIAPSAQAGPASAPLGNPHAKEGSMYPAVPGMVPVVLWLPPGTAPSQFFSSAPPQKDHMHPVMWVLLTVIVMLLIHIALSRNGCIG